MSDRLRFYTAQGMLTTEDAVDCVVQYSEADAVRLGLPLEREPEPAPPSTEPTKRAPRPADKAVRKPADK